MLADARYARRSLAHPCIFFSYFLTTIAVAMPFEGAEIFEGMRKGRSFGAVPMGLGFVAVVRGTARGLLLAGRGSFSNGSGETAA